MERTRRAQAARSNATDHTISSWNGASVDGLGRWWWSSGLAYHLSAVSPFLGLRRIYNWDLPMVWCFLGSLIASFNASPRRRTCHRSIQQSGNNQSVREKIMSKDQNSKKKGQNKPPKTAKEKKQAKKQKRAEKDNPQIPALWSTLKNNNNASGICLMMERASFPILRSWGNSDAASPSQPRAILGFSIEQRGTQPKKHW